MFRRTRHPRWLDGVLTLAGLVFGGASLAYPLALDSAVNYYVAREWLLRGALPYRDSFDHRAPGIYLVHATCIALFGEHAWGIHVAEMVVVVAIGWLAALAVTARGRRPGVGVAGVAVLCTAVFYYGFFDYWCTAQCELWCVLAIMTALAAIRRAPVRVASVIAGLACSAAFLVKPPAAPLIAVVMALLVARARGRRLLASAGAFAAAAVAPLVAVVAYFAARGGLPALVDVLVGANAYYVSHEPPNFGAPLVAHYLGLAWRFFAPFDTLVVGASMVGAARAWLGPRSEPPRYALVFAMLAAVVVAVVVQRKFYLYHWSLAVVPVSLLAATIAQGALASARARRAWVSAGVLAAVVLGFYARTGGPFDTWLRTSRATLSWALGRADGAQLAAAYSKLDHFYSYHFVYADRARVGLWIRDHSAPEDKILVRGMAAEIYALSGRRAPGRFFWSLFLTLPTRAYHREHWLDEDREAIERDPPRYVVAYADIPRGVDSPSSFSPLGYVVRERVANFVIMERATQ